MLERLAARGVLDREPDLLQRYPAMVVGAEHLDARLLQRAEEASLPGRLIVFALAIVVAVPNGFILEQCRSPLEDAHIVQRRWLVAPLQVGAGRRETRRLPARGAHRTSRGDRSHDDHNSPYHRARLSLGRSRALPRSFDIRRLPRRGGAEYKMPQHE